MPPVMKKKVTPAAQVERTILYPEYSSEVYHGDKPLTVALAKDFLGWTEETEKEKFKDEFDLTDLNGVKVQLRNNLKNRPFDEKHAKALAQDILNNKFAPHGPNGEAVIIGKTGLTLSAQHRLCGLVFAGQMWAKDETGHWKSRWATEPTIETFVTYGVDESDETTLTLDNVRTRTLSDSLYTSGLWKSIPHSRRERLTKVLENSIRFLWSRLGMGDDAFSPYRTNSEQKDFMDRHKSLTRAVKAIFDEENPAKVEEGSPKKPVSRFVPIGRASGLQYLQMASASDPAAYREADPRGEDNLDMKNRDKALEFWTLLIGGSGKFILVHKAIAELDNEETMAKGTVAEKEAIIVKAWLEWINNKPITDAALKLDYKADEEGNKYLTDFPTVGGVDFGGAPADGPSADDPTPEEIEAQRMEIRKAKQEEMKAKLRAKQGGGGLQDATPKDKEEFDKEKADKAGKTNAAPAKKPAVAKK